jgi:hypothetical protein
MRDFWERVVLAVGHGGSDMRVVELLSSSRSIASSVGATGALTTRASSTSAQIPTPGSRSSRSRQLRHGLHVEREGLRRAEDLFLVVEGGGVG